LRRLVEDEKLVLETGPEAEAHLLGARQHAAERPARAHLLRLVGEFAQEEQPARLGRKVAAGLGNDPDRRIGICRVPAGIAHVVVELVVGIPPKHHVAKPESGLERGEELVHMQILAAQDAVGVMHAHLDMAQPAFADDAARILGRPDFARLHTLPPA
jgi:hypothetical protein